MQFHIFDSSDFLSHACALKNKWGIYISITFGEGDRDYEISSEILKAIPFLTEDQVWNILLQDDCAFLLFETEKEMNEAFQQCVGDEGPTKYNPYPGDKVQVFALSCDNLGNIIGENT